MICEACGTSPRPDNHVDVYNDWDNEPGVMICDNCLEEECRKTCSAPFIAIWPKRPEGYYHSPIGTLD